MVDAIDKPTPKPQIRILSPFEIIFFLRNSYKQSGYGRRNSIN